MKKLKSIGITPPFLDHRPTNTNVTPLDSFEACIQEVRRHHIVEDVQNTCINETHHLVLSERSRIVEAALYYVSKTYFATHDRSQNAQYFAQLDCLTRNYGVSVYTKLLSRGQRLCNSR